MLISRKMASMATGNQMFRKMTSPAFTPSSFAAAQAGWSVENRRAQHRKTEQ